VLSATARKSVTDLSRRRARTVFTVATLALAVASLSFLAIPTLIDRAMQDEVREGRLADVSVAMRPLPLTAAQLAAIEALPNVAAVEPRSGVSTRVLVGERRAAARVIGVPDFARQQVDLVRVESGQLPEPGELLSEIQNANTGRFDGREGDTVTLVGPGGAEGPTLAISGRGRNLPGGEDVQDDGIIVFYADAATVARLSGEEGYGRLSLLLDDPSPAAAADTVETVRRQLATVPGFTGFANLPEVRAPGEWPGRDETEQFAEILSVITVLALLSALVLISNTMTTLVAEQTGEVAIMRAVGARRRQIGGVYLRTALLLGMLGALSGVALGIVLANLLARYFGQVFWAVEVGFGVDAGVALAGVVVGLVGPALAALPAIRRATRVDLREALGSTGSAVGGGGAERLLRRVAFLPRTMQIGLRNLGRRRRRNLATVLIVALAVGNLLATMGLAASVGQLTRAEWDDHLEDIRVWTTGRATFDRRAEAAIRSTPGVAAAQPALVNDVSLDGRAAFVWGVPHEPLFRHRIVEGRWFDADEAGSGQQVAVIERNLARVAGVSVGELVTLDTAAGPVMLRVVGIARNQQENGTVLFVPLRTLRTALGVPGGTTTFWIRGESSDEALVDRLASQLEDRLGALGYELGNEITYVAKADNVEANRTITTSIALLGFVVVAISMVALANAITTNVLERTREIGILRCIGARARDVRRIFATEGVALAVAGWAAGIPLGYALEVLLVWLLRQVLNVEIPITFPPGNVAIALAGTVVLALVVLALPVRRAVRFRPGDALRYA
jgi:putative ABC transport system permease protein